MDRNSFDGIARLLGTAGTRRAALGALLGVAALGMGVEQDSLAKRRKKRRRKKPGQPKFCYGTSACPPPEAGKDLDDCDYAGTSVFVGANAGGSSFRRGNFTDAILDDANLQGTKFLNANMTGASMVGVDLRGASLNGSCMLDADLTDFLFEGPILADAFVCNTRIGNEVFNRDCNNLPSCCLQ
jgi:uncharacterized protein YjbI with pentapeptide repeats